MDLQLELVQAMARREGWTVTNVYRDDDTSGRRTANRPGLKALRSAYDSGKFDVAVAHALSRFARNMSDGAEIVGQMPLASVLEGVQDTDDDFPALLHFLLAHKQSQEIRKRWAEVHNYRIALGLPAGGGERFGYVFTPSLVTDVSGTRRRTAPEDTYRIDEQLAPVIRDIYSKYLSGMGFRGIAFRLNEAGVTNTKGKTWEQRAVSDYMDSGFAAGYIRHGDQLLDGAHDPIISEDTWKAYQRARKDRARTPARTKGSDWLYRYVAKCSKCAGPLSVHRNHRGTAYVRCSRKALKGKSVCEGVFYRLDAFEGQTVWHLAMQVERWAGAMPDNSEQRNALEAKASRIEGELAAVTEQLGKLAQGWATGILDDDGYREARATVDAEKARLTAEKDDVDVELGSYGPEAEDALALLVERSEGITPDEEAESYKRLFEGIYLSDSDLRFVYRDGKESTVERRYPAGGSMPLPPGTHARVRAWAKSEGIDVPTRGKMPADLIARWQQETGE